MSDKKNLFECIETAESLQVVRSSLYSLNKSLERFRRHFKSDDLTKNETLFVLFKHFETLKELDELIENTIDVIFKR